ncbi:hypothetical protein L218DRAFT_80461 [Marasmius fiardii PR-910]|nr:hypothetical protein L218DRAFT_80461 [Marasmius fiardii PR-910]
MTNFFNDVLENDDDEARPNWKLAPVHLPLSIPPPRTLNTGTSSNPPALPHKETPVTRGDSNTYAPPPIVQQRSQESYLTSTSPTVYSPATTDVDTDTLVTSSIYLPQSPMAEESGAASKKKGGWLTKIKELIGF